VDNNKVGVISLDLGIRHDLYIYVENGTNSPRNLLAKTKLAIPKN